MNTRHDWSAVERASLDRAAQAQAEMCGFLQRTDRIPPAFRTELEQHEARLAPDVAWLTRRDHDLAFIGDIGVGKTTALCRLGGLVLQEQPGRTEMVLAVGSGRTTLCEVEIAQGDRIGIEVEPLPDDEVRDLAGELAEDLWARETGTGAADCEGHVSKEVERALLNMAGLSRRPPKVRKGGGETVAEVIAASKTLESFRGAFVARLGLGERTERTWRHACGSPSEGLRELKGLFADLNHGRRRDFPLPRRIGIIVPTSLLPAAAGPVRLIDTKGVDETVMRPDLERRAADDRALLVYCTSFNDAPNATVRTLLEDLVESGREEILDRSVVLALPRPGEALAMQDESGEPVASPGDGYEVRKEQIRDALHGIGVPELPILFLDSNTDDPRQVAGCLADQVRRMRHSRRERLDETSAAIERLLRDHSSEAERAVRDEALRRLAITLKADSALPPRQRHPSERLAQELRASHARTVYAATRRCGCWRGISVESCLRQTAMADAEHRGSPLVGRLLTLIDHMSRDPDLAAAHGLLSTLRANLKEWHNEFKQRAAELTVEALAGRLHGDVQFWVDCKELWGCGRGYRDAVARKVRTWFESATAQTQLVQLERSIELAWRTLVLRPLRQLSVEGTHGPLAPLGKAARRVRVGGAGGALRSARM
jgi:hypothetical protein